jgi:UDP-N-acetylenolpyruvoylglucosamine reductase
MRISDPKIVAGLAKLDIELRHGTSLAELTYLGIGGTTDLLRINKHESIPRLLRLLDENHVPYRFLGGGSNLLVGDGELPWVVLQLVQSLISFSKARWRTLMRPQTSAARLRIARNMIWVEWRV